MTQASEWPATRPLKSTDLIEALARGANDMRAAPRFGLIFGLAYAVAGWALIALLWVFGLPFLAYPLAMGFTLIAPFAVAGLYAVSDQLERGVKPTWGSVLAAMRDASRRDLRWMALITGFALVIWLDIAAFSFFAFNSFSAFDQDFLTRLFTTPTGLVFLVLGNAIGAILAAGVFSISVVSFPMLYDRDIDFVTAMVTSVRLVLANPLVMLAWGVFIGVATVLSLLSLFVGLILTLPLIGHASWHLYRRAVATKDAVTG